MNTLLIAEIGINHNGDVNLAKKMIEAAATSGANAVKFQVHIADQEMVSDLSSHVRICHNLYDIIKNCELTFDEFKELKTHCQQHGVKFFATPFSLPAVDWLGDIGVDLYKVGSGETSNLLLLKKIIDKKKKILISTGMSTLEEVRITVSFLDKYNADYVLMQCTSEYPASYSSINLNVLKTYQDIFRCQVGLSDHAPSIYPALAAVAMGACAVEKHFTTDRSLPGPDQKSSIDPDNFRQLADGILAIEESMGSYDKQSIVAADVRQLFMHGLTASRDILKGEEFSLENITSKRPLIGIPASEFRAVLGKRANTFIKADTQIAWEDVSI